VREPRLIWQNMHSCQCRNLAHIAVFKFGNACGVLQFYKFACITTVLELCLAVFYSFIGCSVFGLVFVHFLAVFLVFLFGFLFLFFAVFSFCLGFFGGLFYLFLPT
jgi:hypothetical protein